MFGLRKDVVIYLVVIALIACAMTVDAVHVMLPEVNVNLSRILLKQ